jgi:hypothetical protein
MGGYAMEVSEQRLGKQVPAVTDIKEKKKYSKRATVFSVETNPDTTIEGLWLPYSPCRHVINEGQA